MDASGEVVNPSAQAWLNQSLRAYQAGNYRGSLDAALQALHYRPDYAEAFNNMAAAHNAMHEWAAAIDAANHALTLRADFPLARNNREWALAQVAKAR